MYKSYDTVPLSVLSDDHRSRHNLTGIELLAIDTFPRTVNDRCVSSPKINMLRCRRLLVPHLFFHGLLLGESKK